MVIAVFRDGKAQFGIVKAMGKPMAEQTGGVGKQFVAMGLAQQPIGGALKSKGKEGK